MKMKYTIWICLIVIISACSKDYQGGEVLVRIKNQSDYDFKNLEFNPGSSMQVVGELKSGKSSDYYSFETAYHYGYISLNVDGEDLGLTPIDYVGETPLKSGKYTYVLDVVGNSGQNLSLTLIFVKD